jgi:hypothetical protein
MVPCFKYNCYGHKLLSWEPHLITFWNSRSAEKDRGFADLAAKKIKPKQEITVQTHMRSYTAKDGTTKTGFIAIPNTLLIGDVSNEGASVNIDFEYSPDSNNYGYALVKQ